MTIQKNLKIPICTRRSVRKEFALFREKSDAIPVFGLHVKEEGDALVCAEGREDLGELPDGTLRLLRAEGQAPALFADLGEGSLVRLKDETAYSLPCEPLELLSKLDKNGAECYVALTEEGVFLLGEQAVQLEGVQGCCGAVHHERLFVADGFRVRFSAPLSSDFSEGLQAGGYVDLPSSAGKVLHMISYKEKLFLFREQGITLLRASGDPLGFSAEAIPYSCGRAIPGSFANCGRTVLFLTESGLYSFNGNYCSLLEECGAAHVSRSHAIEAVSADGKYYATVHACGEDCLYCVDPLRKRGHFIRVRPQSLAGGRRLRYVRDGRLYALTERGAGERSCTVETELSLFGLSEGEKFLDGLTIEGRGNFSVSASAERGLSRRVCGKAGERLSFSVPLRGNAFRFRIRTQDERFLLRAVTLTVREADV